MRSPTATPAKKMLHVICRSVCLAANVLVWIFEPSHDERLYASAIKVPEAASQVAETENGVAANYGVC